MCYLIAPRLFLFPSAPPLLILLLLLSPPLTKHHLNHRDRHCSSTSSMYHQTRTS